jgi:transposase
MEAGNSQALIALIADLRKKVSAKLGVESAVMSCFEAGRDGFWLHRLLSEHGVINHVVEPTSILVNRRARRAKTDRLDAQGLLRILTAHAKGDHDVCSVVHVPTIEEEDAKRQHREREHLVQERVRIENRIAALLTTQGVRKRPSLRSWQKDMEEMRTGDGHPIPPFYAPR